MGFGIIHPTVALVYFTSLGIILIYILHRSR